MSFPQAPAHGEPSAVSSQTVPVAGSASPSPVPPALRADPSGQASSADVSILNTETKTNTVATVSCPVCERNALRDNSLLSSHGSGPNCPRYSRQATEAVPLREAGAAPSLEVFKARLDGALSTLD